MKIKAVLFDLDGTLLSMDQDEFIKEYLKAITTYLSAYGYDPSLFAKAMWKGTAAMVENDGTRKNEAAFWEVFEKFFPHRDIEADKQYLDQFYKEKFDSVKDKVARPNPLAVEAVRLAKDLGLRVILATNPFFPPIATKKRIEWAGLRPDDFEMITTYEDSTFAKPSLGYYKEVLSRALLTPEDCIMVGNDVSDDMVARDLGMDVFLVTENLINKENADISQYRNGTLGDLALYLKSL